MNNLRILKTLMIIGVLFALGTEPVFAQSEAGKDSARHAGNNALSSGSKALAAGKYGAAISDFTKAMTSEKLSAAELAKALYQRGVAYRNNGKPAQAIADLTKALWLKKLSAEDRGGALRNRSFAYEAVGQKQRAAADAKSAPRRVSSGKSSPGASVSASHKKTPSGDWKTAVSDEPSKTKSASRPRRGGIAGFFGNLRSRVKGKTATTAAIVKPAKSKKIASTSRSEPKSSHAVSRQSAPKPSVPKPSASSESAGWATDVAEQQKRRGFFGLASRGQRSSLFSSVSVFDGDGAVNVFSAGDTSRRPSSTPRAAREPHPKAAAGGAWIGSTKIAKGTTDEPAANLLFTGYRIQLAALSSETSAKESWRRLVAKHKSLLTGWDPEFRNIANSETVGVQIGPFADKDEPRALCKSFKKKGLDCIIVSR